MVSKLRFGFYRLPANEVALVKAYFRLFATRHDFPWEVAESGPMDVVLTGIDAAHVPSELCHTHSVTLRTVDHGVALDGENWLARPLRSDRLEAWLLGVEGRFMAGRSAPSGSLPEKKKVVERVKLSRWPPALLLRKDPMRIRMATMLMKRALSIDEMGKVSAWSNDQCQHFIDAMKTMGLLQSISVQAIPVIEKNAAGDTSALPLSEGFFVSR
jgi:hypothetical protein